MTDIFDQASELEEKRREIALSFHNPKLTPCGACFNCSEPVAGTLIFCDTDCAPDYQHQEKMKIIWGKL
jgi:hypothetical protein